MRQLQNMNRQSNSPSDSSAASSPCELTNTNDASLRIFFVFLRNKYDMTCWRISSRFYSYGIIYYAGGTQQSFRVPKATYIRFPKISKFLGIIKNKNPRQ